MAEHDQGDDGEKVFVNRTKEPLSPTVKKWSKLPEQIKLAITRVECASTSVGSCFVLVFFFGTTRGNKIYL
jgi:hypothetical protein